MKKIAVIVILIILMLSVGACNIILQPTDLEVDFKLNGGTIDGKEEYNKTFTSYESTLLPFPLKDGYTFEGWYLDEVFSSSVITNTMDLSYYGSKTNLFAKWRAIRYTVKYEKNNPKASGEMYNSNMIFDLPQGLNQNEYVLKSNTFLGWSTSPSGEGHIFSDREIVSNLSSERDEIVTLYAIWEAHRYLVRYDKNSEFATGEMPNQHLTLEVQHKLDNNIFAREGYSFMGWSLTASGKVVFENGDYVMNLTESSKTISLYAVWEANTYKIEYNGNGAYESMPGQYLTYDKSVELSTNKFTKIGYVFAGWSNTASGKVLYLDNATIKNLSSGKNGIVQLFAIWTPIEYNIQFESNGALGSMENQVMTYDSNSPLPENAFVKEGYKFIGWATSESGQIIYNDKEEVKNLLNTSGSITLFAQWKSIEYTITYHANDEEATGVMPNQTFSYDISQTLKQNAFSKIGYHFVGWATSENVSATYTDKQIISNLTNKEGNVDFYAVWKANNYSIVFDRNSNLATGFMSNQTMSYDKVSNFDSNKYDLIGHYFAGWAESKNGERKYQDQDLVSNLTSVKEASITLYAIWIAKENIATPTSYELTYNGLTQDAPFTFEDAKYSIMGTLNAKNTDTYYIDIELKDKITTQWSDGTTETKQVCWQIVKAELKLRINNKSVSYGQNSPIFDFTISGLINGENLEDINLINNLTFISDRLLSSNVGTYKIYSKGNISSDNYYITIDEGSIDVIKAKATIILEDLAVNKFNETPEFTYKEIGFVNGESIKSLGIQIDLDYNYATMNTEGSIYTITPSGVDSTLNYDITYVSGKLKINELIDISLDNIKGGMPYSSDLTYGQKLRELQVNSASHILYDNTVIEGTFSLANPDFVLSAGTHNNVSVNFVPTGDAYYYYNIFNFNMTVNIAKADYIEDNILDELVRKLNAIYNGGTLEGYQNIIGSQYIEFDSNNNFVDKLNTGEYDIALVYNRNKDNYNNFEYLGKLVISKVTLDIPNPSVSLVYNEQTQDCGIVANENYLITGNMAKDSGDYIAVLEIVDTINYKWTDNTITKKEISWSISKAEAENAKDYVALGQMQATYGDTLEAISLPDGYAWVLPTSTSLGNAGLARFETIFTPNDTINYKTKSFYADIVISKVDISSSVTITLANWKYNSSPNEPIIYNLPEEFSNPIMEYSLDSTSWIIGYPTMAETYYARFTFEETLNYKKIIIQTSFAIEKAVPTYQIPTNIKAVYENTLKDVVLPKGFSFVLNPNTSVGNTGLQTFKVNFTPEDIENYEMVYDITINILVEKKLVVYTQNILEENYLDNSQEFSQVDFSNLYKDKNWGREYYFRDETKTKSYDSNFDLREGATTFGVYIVLENENEYVSQWFFKKFKSVTLDSAANATYYTIEDALNLATSGTVVVRYNTSFANHIIGKIIYNNDGYYTVKGNVTILLPFDDTYNTSLTANIDESLSTIIDRRNPFVNLKVPENLTVFVNGTMNINSKKTTYNTSVQGVINGNNYAILTLAYNSNLIVGGASGTRSLNVNGFVIGEGTVKVESGATAYDSLTILGFKGGSVTSVIYKSIFPFNQYVFNNIEAKLVIKTGGIFNARATAKVSTSWANPILCIVGTSSSGSNMPLLRMTSEGELIRTYDLASGRTKFEAYVNLAFQDVSVAVGVTATSKDKEIPLFGNMTYILKSGFNLDIGVRLKFLPGAELIIESGAVANISKTGRVLVYGNGEFNSYYAKRSDGTTVVYPNSLFKQARTLMSFDFNLNTPAKLVVNGILNVDGQIAGELTTDGSSGEINFLFNGNTSMTVREDITVSEGIFGTKLSYYDLTSNLKLNIDGQVKKADKGNYQAYANKWILRDTAKYNITFNDTFGKVFKLNSELGYLNNELKNLFNFDSIIPTKDGYIFDGWYRDINYTKPLNGAVALDENLEVYSKWKEVKDSIKITLDAMGGSGGTRELNNVERGTALQLYSYQNPSNVSGFVFDGWYLEPTYLTKIEDTFIFDADTTIYAKYKHSIEITFNANSGAFDSNFANRVYGGKTVDKDLTQAIEYGNFEYGENIKFPAQDPKKPNYKFLGWFTASNFLNGIKIEANSKCNFRQNSVVLYALWEYVGNTPSSTFKVTFNGNGGVLATTDIPSFAYGSKLSEYPIDAPLRAGYDFAGWYLDIACTYELGNVPLYAAVTVYAKYTLNDAQIFTVSLHSNGGSGTPNVVVATNTRLSEYNDLIALPTRANYIFDGWSYDRNGYTPYNNEQITFNTTLYAQWVANTTVTVTLNVNGGANGSVNARYIKPGSSMDMTGMDVNIIPTRSGYTFDGWHYEVSCINKYANEKIYNNITLYAKWIPEQGTTPANVTVTLSAKDGTGGTPSLSIALGTTLEENGFVEPTRKGYTFAGWYLNASCTSLAVTDQAIYGAVTLYAGWIANIDNMTKPGNLTVTLNPNGGISNGGTISIPYFVKGDKLSNYTIITPQRVGYVFDGWYFDAGCRMPYNDEEINNAITLNAGWKFAPTYTVSFNVNGGVSTVMTVHGGSSGVATARYVPENGVIDQLNLIIYERAGYKFTGWFLDAAHQGRPFDANTKITSNLALYAGWLLDDGTLPNPWKVTLSANGGTVGTVAIDKYPYSSTLGNCGTTIIEPTRSGYTFAGWFADATCTIFLANDTPITPIAAITIYAGWIPNIEGATSPANFAVTLNVNGGLTNSGTASIPYFVKGDKLSNYPIIVPQRIGYIFDGWSFDIAGTSSYDDNNILAATTLYAKWMATPTVAVTLNVNGGKVSATTFYMTATLILTPRHVAIGEKLDLSQLTHIREGYIFGGWYYEPSCVREYTNQAIDTRVTLYAKWIPDSQTSEFIITFNSNGGKSGSANIANFVIGTQLSGYTYTKPTKDGYHFGGWYLDASCTAEVLEDTSLFGAATLYAKWIVDENAVPTSFNITVNSNGGVGGINMLGFAYGQTIREYIALNQDYKYPTFQGYTFAGWYSDTTLSIKIGEDVPIYNGMTMYAGWVQDKFVLTLESNGGTNAVPKIYLVEDKFDDSLIQSIPTRNGYKFVGWFLDAAHQGRPFDANTKITNNLSLYAGWQLDGGTLPNPWKVTLSANLGIVGTVAIDKYPYSSTLGNCDTTIIEPTRSGYTFAGWFADAACTIFLGNNTPITPTAAITIYAGWIPNIEGATSPANFAVTLNINGGVSSSGTASIPYFVKGDKLSNYTIVLPQRIGYIFDGWSYDIAGTSSYDDNNILAATTLYAKWMATPTFVVTLNVNGGVSTVMTAHGVTSKVDATRYVPENGVIDQLNLIIYERAGYKFTGWFLDAAHQGRPFDANTKITSNLSLYAGWLLDDGTLPNLWNVTLSANGGIGGTVAIDKYPYSSTLGNCGTAIIEPTRSGYTFAGWFVDAACTIFLANDTPITPTAAITIYAGWIPQTDNITDVKNFSVSLNANGGFANNGTNLIPYFISGDSLSRYTIIKPERVGYVFDGWSYDVEGLSEYNNHELYYTTTLYAQWREATTHAISVDLKGGNMATKTYYESTTAVSGIRIVEDNTIFDIDILTVERSGYEFVGWFLDTNNLSRPFDKNVPIKESMSIYAGWQPVDGTATTNITVTLNPNDGVAKSEVIPSYTYGRTINNCGLSIVEPKLEGYVFAGWYMDANCTIFVGNDAPITASMTLYAGWEKDDQLTYRITFLGNYGLLGTQILRANIGQSLADLEIALPTRIGYKFDGWYLDSAGTIAYKDEPIYGATTLYAKWVQAPTITLTLNENGGKKGSVSLRYLQVGEKFDMTGLLAKGILPELEGYTFAGWYYDPSSIIEYRGEELHADTTLYAKWEKD